MSDAKVVLRDAEHDALQAADHLEVAVVTPDDEFLRFAVDARSTGKASVFLLTADGEQISDPRIQAAFRLLPGGYLMELRLPRSLVGPRLGFTIVDVDDPVEVGAETFYEIVITNQFSNHFCFTWRVES